MASKWGWVQQASEVQITTAPTEVESEIETIEKHLVYYTIGGDIKFIESLELSIKSLRLFGEYTGDILIITDNICYEQVKEKFKDCYILNINDYCIHCEASINKLKIYQYENIKNYNKIIYLDLDILIQNDISIIFKAIKDKFIFSNELDTNTRELAKVINNDYHGKLLFSDKEAFVYDLENRNSINGGFFGFSMSMLHHFEKILIDVEIDRKISSDRKDWCCEQATINKYMIINNIYDDSISDKILHFAAQYSYEDIDIQKKILLHFCWGVGNHEYKMNYMKPWYNYLLEKQSI
jgi:hypothetical protein